MGKITRNELSPIVIEELDSTLKGIAESNEQLGVVVNKSTLRDKELAYLKLKQDANERIEGGTTFADDFGGNGFGITFNAEESENVLNKDGALTMNAGSMVEYSVDDSIVVSGIYNTSGNGGRKLVMLDNGTLVCAIKDAKTHYIYKSTDNGISWSLINSGTSANIADVAIVTDGVRVFVIIFGLAQQVTQITLDENGGTINENTIPIGTLALDTCSLTINEEGTELHACWSNKTSTYPNSYNIQYCKGIIGENGSVTWGSVEQLTTYTSSSETAQYPSITLKSNNTPIIIFRYYNGSYQYIYTKNMEGSKWVTRSLYSSSSSYLQLSPSVIFVPKSINGLENGRIWVAWYGQDSTNPLAHNIRVVYSDNQGVTWSEMKKITSGSDYSQEYPSITANKNNEVFITWSGKGSGSVLTAYSIKQIKWSNGSWGEIKVIKPNIDKNMLHPNVLCDIKFNIEVNIPPTVYAINAISINFTGAWTAGGYTPTTTATAAYNLPATDYVGLFVQKAGSIDVTATINGEPMESEIDGDEYQFTKALDAANDVTLKLSLSRSDTTNGDNDKITRILGGTA